MQKVFEFLKDWVVPKKLYSLFMNCYYFAVILLSSKSSFFVNNSQLKDKYKGKRCFVMGSGPSLKTQDLMKLSGEHVISVSSTYNHKDITSIDPLFHVLPPILSAHSEFRSNDYFSEMLIKMEKVLPNANFLMHYGDKTFIENAGVLTNNKIYFNKYRYWDEEVFKSIDISFVRDIGSVSETAIELAMYLGFDEIYLIGFDHDWFNGAMVYFFKPDDSFYIDHGFDSESQMRRHATMFKKYKCLYNLKKNIYNANSDKDSYVDVFPKVDFDSLFDK